MELREITELLGGEKVLGRRLENRFDVVELSYQGISKVALANLVPMSTIPGDLKIMELDVPERIIPEDIDPVDLPTEWRKYPPPNTWQHWDQTGRIQIGHCCCVFHLR